MKIETPLVSVVIPCYNQAHYLPKAIESVKKQTYPAIEIIVVDDGSTDDTRAVAGKYPEVKYIFQTNRGLSAARNTGIKQSQGEYLVFLDSDDWLYPRGIEYNMHNMQPHFAFVFGTYDEVFVDDYILNEVVQEFSSDSYNKLLQYNFIGMIATVLFRSSVFNEFLYDPALKNCEDYDLYLKIARQYHIGYHTNKIAAYRLHGSSMSSNIPAMLEGILLMRRRHERDLMTSQEWAAYKQGCLILKSYYCQMLYTRLRRKRVPVTKQALNTLLKHKPDLYLKYLITRLLLK